MVTIDIGEKQFSLKYTLESWKKLKENCGITPQNAQEKLNEDPASTLSSLVYYGILPKEREGISAQEIDENTSFEAVDIVLEAIKQNLPKAMRESERADGAEKK